MRSKLYLLTTIYILITINNLNASRHIYFNSWREIEKYFELIKQENLVLPSENEVRFEEDIFLAGFTPTAAIIPKPKNDQLSDEGLQLKARLKIFGDFESFYREHCQRLDNVETSHFINEVLNSDIKQALDDLQSSQSFNANVTVGDSNENCDSNDIDDKVAEDVENNAENIVVNGDALHVRTSNKLLKASFSNAKMENDQLSQLSKLKRELEAKSNVKKMYSNKLEVRCSFVIKYSYC